MKYVKDLLIALVQLVIMVLLYPLLFSIALNWKSDKCGFSAGRFLLNSRSKHFIYIFPGFGKWYLPIVDL